MRPCWLLWSFQRVEFLFLTCRRGGEQSCFLPHVQIPPRETAGTEGHHRHSILLSCHCRQSSPSRSGMSLFMPSLLLFPFLPYTVLGHFQTYTPMGLSSFYSHHTLACFSLKWIIQIVCHSEFLPVATGSGLQLP